MILISLKSLLLLMILSSLACSGKAERETSAAQPQAAEDEESPPANTPPSSGGGQRPTSTVAACNSAGNAFSAVVLPGMDASGCLGPLASFGCCQETVAALFLDEALVSDLNGKFAQNIGKGMTLYNCEKMGDDQYRFHFAKRTGQQGMEYANVTGSGASRPEGEVNVSCPQIPDTSFLNSSEGEGDKDLQLAFSDMQPLIIKNCGSCHGEDNSFVKSESAFREKSQEIKRRLELPESNAERMPEINEDNPEDMDETERLALIMFIQNHL